MIKIYAKKLNEHNFQKENVRRKHNYLPLIMELLKVLAEEGKLADQIKLVADRQMSKKSKALSSSSTSSSSKKKH